MKIAVCVKQTVDTEALVTLNDEGGIDTEGAALIIDPYAEFAVEKAVQLKEEQGGEVIVVTLGSQESLPAIRHALSMGADRAILIDDDVIDESDSRGKARVLSRVLEELEADLIMGGCKSGDTARAQTLPRIATIMGIPQVNMAVDLKVVEGGVIASHEIEDGVENVSVALPAVVSAQQGLAEPRYPNVRDIMQSKKKPIDTRTLGDLGIDPASVDGSSAQIRIESYALKQERAGGRIVEGETPDAVAEVVSALTTEAKVL